MSGVPRISEASQSSLLCTCRLNASGFLRSFFEGAQETKNFRSRVTCDDQVERHDLALAQLQTVAGGTRPGCIPAQAQAGLVNTDAERPQIVRGDNARDVQLVGARSERPEGAVVGSTNARPAEEAAIQSDAERVIRRGAVVTDR
jgi:hypothetical protein